MTKNRSGPRSRLASLLAAFGLAALFAGALVACLATPDDAPPDDDPPELGDVEQESIFAPCNETIGCRTNPGDVERACEEAYGSTSGKPYNLFCDCAPGSNCTNSDCFSNCFRNDCRCGVTDGRAGGCDDVPMIEPDPEWHSCTCARTDTGIHNYWCCQAQWGGDSGHTVDGWSCGDYCGDGGDVTTPPCTSIPPES